MQEAAGSDRGGLLIRWRAAAGHVVARYMLGTPQVRGTVHQRFTQTRDSARQ
jgi:hypothetical protein